jgi:hypothetical protein
VKSKIAMAALFVILSLSVGASGYFYSKHHFSLEADLQRQQIISLQNQIVNLTAQTSSMLDLNLRLQEQNVDLQTENANLTSHMEALETENANLKAKVADLEPYQPNGSILVTRLGTTDVPNNNDAHGTFQPRLFIEGNVFNLGDITANNARLHVTLYLNGQIIDDAYIELGNIEPLSFASVRQDIHYEANGQKLTNWTIIPETKTV